MRLRLEATLLTRTLVARSLANKREQVGGICEKGRAVRDAIISRHDRDFASEALLPVRRSPFSRTLLNITSSQPLVGPVPVFRRPSSGFPSRQQFPRYEVVGAGTCAVRSSLSVISLSVSWSVFFRFSSTIDRIRTGD